MVLGEIHGLEENSVRPLRPTGESGWMGTDAVQRLSYFFGMKYNPHS